MDQNQQLFTAMRFYFLYVDRYVFGAGWVFPDSHLPYAMVRYILRGSAEFVVDGRSFLVHEGQVVYLPDGCRLGCHTMDQTFEFYSIRFKSATQLGAEDLLRDHFHIRLVNDCAGDTSILSYFDQVYRSATSQNPGKAFRVRGNLELIIAWLVEQAGVQPARSSAVREDTPFNLRYDLHLNRLPQQDPRIGALVDYIVDHPTEQFTTESLCRTANLSPSSLRRLFKRYTGKSPGAFIQDLRLMVAARRLLVTDARISDIAYEVGFEDPNYFSRMFRRNFGASPQEYRRNAQ